eukprot:5164856-Prymnesium_polylepis.1
MAGEAQWICGSSAKGKRKRHSLWCTSPLLTRHRRQVRRVTHTGRRTCRGSGGCTGSESTVCAQTRAA